MSLHTPLTFVNNVKYNRVNEPHTKQGLSVKNNADPNNKTDGIFRRDMLHIWNKNGMMKVRNTKYNEHMLRKYGHAGLLATRPRENPQGSFIFIQSQTGNLGTKRGPLDALKGSAFTGGYRTNEGKKYGTEMAMKRAEELQNFKNPDYVPSSSASKAEPSMDLDSPQITALILILDQIEQALNYNDSQTNVFSDILVQKEIGKLFSVIAQNILLTPLSVQEKIFIKLSNIVRAIESQFFSNDYQEFNASDFTKVSNLYSVLAKSRVLVEIAISLNNYSTQDRKTIFKSLQKDLLTKKVSLQGIITEIRREEGETIKQTFVYGISKFDELVDNLVANYKGMIANLNPLSSELQQQIDSQIQENYNNLINIAQSQNMPIEYSDTTGQPYLPVSGTFTETLPPEVQQYTMAELNQFRRPKLVEIAEQLQIPTRVQGRNVTLPNLRRQIIDLLYPEIATTETEGVAESKEDEDEDEDEEEEVEGRGFAVHKKYAKEDQPLHEETEDVADVSLPKAIYNRMARPSVSMSQKHKMEMIKRQMLKKASHLKKLR